MIWLFSQMLIERSDGLYAGHPYVWSDWSLHLGMARIFATKEPSLWFATHPLYAGGKFTYGFLTNLITGLLMRSGMPVAYAFNLPSVIYAVLLVMGLFRFGIYLTKSKMQSALMISIFFLSSGLGFINFIHDFIQDPSWKMFFYPIIEYSKNEVYEWGSGNVLTGILVPQRAFLLGLTISIWSLNGLFWGLSRKLNSKSKLILLGSGLLAGILPITHMHSYIVMGLIGLTTLIFTYKKWRYLFYFAIPAILLGSLLYFLFISGGIENPNFMQWFPGWTAKNGILGWLKMWWLLWGIMIPFIIWVLFKNITNIPKFLIIITFASVGIFTIANLILFQPVHWDNSKLFFWAYLGFSALAAYGLARLWKGAIINKIIAIFLFILLTATGSLELLRLINIKSNTYQMISRSEMQFSDQIREQTDPNAVFVTAPIHNHPIVMWSARPILLGYTAWVWNYGFLYQQREKDLELIFQANNDIKPLLKKYAVSYVYIGQREKKDYKPNLSYFYQNFPIAFQSDNTLVFDTRSVMTSE